MKKIICVCVYVYIVNSRYLRAFQFIKLTHKFFFYCVPYSTTQRTAHGVSLIPLKIISILQYTKKIISLQSHIRVNIES